MKSFTLIYHVDTAGVYYLIGGCRDKETVAGLLHSHNISPFSIQDYHAICYTADGEQSVYDGKYYLYIVANRLKKKQGFQTVISEHDTRVVHSMIENNSGELMDYLHNIASKGILIKIKFKDIKSYLDAVKTTMRTHLSKF